MSDAVIEPNTSLDFSDPQQAIEAIDKNVAPEAYYDYAKNYGDPIQKLQNILEPGSYQGLNQVLLGFPEWFRRNILPSAESARIKAMEGSNPESANIGNTAGLVASMLTPLGAGYRIVSGGLKALGAARAAEKVASLGDIARDVTPVTGFFGHLGKGLLQAAPQAVVRTATGNITPEEGLSGLGAGALFGLSGGIPSMFAGGKSGGFFQKFGRGALKEADKTILGASGIGQRDIIKIASYLVPGRNIMERTANAEELISKAAELKTIKALSTPEKVTDFVKNEVDPVYSKVNNAWKESGDHLLGPNAAGILESDPPVEVLTNPQAAQLFLGGHAGDIIQAPSFAKLAEVSPNEARKLLHTVAMADRAGWQQGRQFFSRYGETAAKDAGTEASLVSNMADDAAGDIKSMWDQQAQQLASNSGSISAGELDNMNNLYPAVKLLEAIPQHEAFRLNRSVAGSATAVRMALGGLTGEAYNDLTGQPGNPYAPIMGAILGGTGVGDLANQALTRATNKAMEKGMTKLRPVLQRLAEGGSGKGGKIPPGGTIGPGGAGFEWFAGKGAQTSPLIMSATGGLGASAGSPVEGQRQSIIDSPAVSAPVSDIKSLIDSGNPWLQTMGKRIMQLWAQNYQFSGMTPDQLMQQYYQQTEGFTPAKSTNLLSNDRNVNAALGADMAVASNLQSIDWKNLAYWFGLPGGFAAGPGPLLHLGASLNMRGAREAAQDMQKILQVTRNDRGLQNQIERTMRENGSPEQKKAEILRVLRAAPGVFNYAPALHDLGLI